MNGIARRDASFRRDLFEETGRRRGLRSEVVEKDFWVCWMLKHYYDLALLAKSPVVQSATGRIDLLERVVWHKTTFFNRSWSDFESAKPGTIRLLPPPERRSALEADYRRMRPMFFEDPPPFADILATLQALENSLNENRTPPI